MILPDAALVVGVIFGLAMTGSLYAQAWVQKKRASGYPIYQASGIRVFKDSH